MLRTGITAAGGARCLSMRKPLTALPGERENLLILHVRGLWQHLAGPRIATLLRISVQKHCTKRDDPMRKVSSFQILVGWFRVGPVGLLTLGLWGCVSFLALLGACSQNITRLF